MRMDKFTNAFQAALADAQSIALGHENQVIEPEHVLLAMLSEGDSATASLCQQSGANLATLTDHLQKSIDRFPKVEGQPGQVHVSNALAQLLNRCDQLAQQNQDQYISSELFLLAVIEKKSTLQEMLTKCGVKIPSLQEAIKKMHQQQQNSRIKAAFYGAVLMALVGISVSTLILLMIVERFSLSDEAYTKWVLGSTAVFAGGGGFLGFMFPNEWANNDGHNAPPTTSAADDNISSTDDKDPMPHNPVIN